MQTSPFFGDKKYNFEEIKKLAVDIEVDLLVLPELFATGYTFVSKEEAMKLAEDLDGETARFLIELAKLTGATVVGGFVEKENDKIYNSAMIVSEMEVLGSYRKLHLYFKEKLWFSPGDKPQKVYDVEGIKIGIMVCFDWYFPEMARILALYGADIICHPANLVLPFSQKTMLARSIENRIFTITANRVGSDIRPNTKLTFTGQSQVTSPKMELLAQATEDEEVVRIVEIDPSIASNKMITAKNHAFMDRRIDLYSPILKKDIKKS